MNLAKKKKIVFLLSAFGVLETVFYCYHTKHHHEDIFETTNQDETNIDYVKNLNLTELDIKLQEKLKQATNKKIILFWDPPYGNRIEAETNKSECGSCVITCNKSMIDHPDTAAVLFYISDLLTTTLPNNRRKDQYYTFYSDESPSSAISFYKNLKTYDHVFNLSMSHRQDSDVWCPYGDFITILKSMPPLHKEDQYITKQIKAKTKLVLWVVSNCGFTVGAVKRMKYILELQKQGLRIDLGGKCFPNGVKDWKHEDYKFYFAFENSIHCKDYITEKFFLNAIGKGVVPVVFGTLKKDYEKIAPSGSFIYAQDYSNQELITLLNYLDQNDSAYKEYFEWRKIPVESLKEHNRATTYCQLCRIVHGINYDYIFHRNYYDLYRNLSLFNAYPETRLIPSITTWYYKNENKDCMANVFINHSSNIRFIFICCYVFLALVIFHEYVKMCLEKFFKCKSKIFILVDKGKIFCKGNKNI